MSDNEYLKNLAIRISLTNSPAGEEADREVRRSDRRYVRRDVERKHRARGQQRHRRAECARWKNLQTQNACYCIELLYYRFEYESLRVRVISSRTPKPKRWHTTERVQECGRGCCRRGAVGGQSPEAANAAVEERRRASEIRAAPLEPEAELHGALLGRAERHAVCARPHRIRNAHRRERRPVRDSYGTTYKWRWCPYEYNAHSSLSVHHKQAAKEAESARAMQRKG